MLVVSLQVGDVWSGTRDGRRDHLPGRGRDHDPGTGAGGEQALIEQIHYFFHITTLTEQPTEQIVGLANERCDQENIIGQLNGGIDAPRVPLHDLVSNWAYMVIAALTGNTKSRFALMMHRTTDRHDCIRREFRRFLDTIILIPATIAPVTRDQPRPAPQRPTATTISHTAHRTHTHPGMITKTRPHPPATRLM